ncbi:MAG: metallophosphoesterase [Acidobacteriota bacterium]|nr:metallophosphoesterase [Acidobacteriota bacterium]
MRTLVHLSDIHFGHIDYATIDPLIRTIWQIKPDVVAVSGDLTQRARAKQFQEARTFLDALPKPQIVVPGNHDVPLHNIFARFLSPLRKYRRYITDDLQPFYLDDEIAVLGLNTARSLTIKDGRVNEEQIAHIRERLCPLGDSVVSLLVTHHPFDLPEGSNGELAGRSRQAMQMLDGCGADLLLSGHLHLTSIAARYASPEHSIVLVQAGTATSTRGRGESNSFNVLRIENPRVQIERWGWEPQTQIFSIANKEQFSRNGSRWDKEAVLPA